MGEYTSLTWAGRAVQTQAVRSGGTALTTLKPSVMHRWDLTTSLGLKELFSYLQVRQGCFISFLAAARGRTAALAPASLLGTSNLPPCRCPPWPNCLQKAAARVRGSPRAAAAQCLAQLGCVEKAELCFVGTPRAKPFSIHPARFKGQSNDTRVKNSCGVYSEVSVAGCKGERALGFIATLVEQESEVACRYFFPVVCSGCNQGWPVLVQQSLRLRGTTARRWR